MIDDFSIGDFVCLKNHPYFEKNNLIKISANADMTPPVMVITETFKKVQYDSSTGNREEQQVRCYYYSHKEGKYHNKWLKIGQLKKLAAIKTYLDIEELKNIDKYDIEYLKKYIGKLTCLKSVDFELNKKKVFTDSSDGTRISKENNHLDFLPPVMTIIEVIKNKEEKKYSFVDGKPEKECTKYLFKCKWYNSLTTSYSEDLFPSNILGLVKNEEPTFNLIKEFKDDNNSYYLLTLDKEKKIKNISDKENPIIVKKTLVKINDLAFNHYYYTFEYFDYLFQKRSTSRIGNFKNEKNLIHEKDEIFTNKLPRIIENKYQIINSKDFMKNQYYAISYIDKQDKLTHRCIKVISTMNVQNLENDKITDSIVEAYCLLRNGDVRHFNIARILSYQMIEKGIDLFE